MTDQLLAAVKHWAQEDNAIAPSTVLKLVARLEAAEAVMIPAQSLLSIYDRANDEWGTHLNIALSAWRAAKGET